MSMDRAEVISDAVCNRRNDLSGLLNKARDKGDSTEQARLEALVQELDYTMGLMSDAEDEWEKENY